MALTLIEMGRYPLFNSQMVHFGSESTLYPDFPDKVRQEYRKWNWPEAEIEHSIEGLRKAGLDVPDELAAGE